MEAVWRTLTTLFSIGAVSIAGIAAYLAMNQRRLIYPAHMPEDARASVDTPSDFGFAADAYVDTFIPVHHSSSSADDKIHIYILKARTDPRTRPTLIYCHANAGNMGHRLPIAQRLHQLFDINLVLFSYRGYGQSSGSLASELTMKQDVHALMAYLLHDQHHIPTDRLMVLGQSIGGAVAVYLTHAFPAHVQVLILENTFTSLPDLIPRLMPFTKPFLSYLLTEHWHSDRLVTQFDHTDVALQRVLFLSAVRDEIVPHDMQRNLYDRIPFSDSSTTTTTTTSSSSSSLGRNRGERVKVWREVTRAGHNDIPMYQEYWQSLTEFWDEHVKSVYGLS